MPTKISRKSSQDPFILCLVYADNSWTRNWNKYLRTFLSSLDKNRPCNAVSRPHVLSSRRPLRQARRDVLIVVVPLWNVLLDAYGRGGTRRGIGAEARAVGCDLRRRRLQRSRYRNSVTSNPCSRRLCFLRNGIRSTTSRS